MSFIRTLISNEIVGALIFGAVATLGAALISVGPTTDYTVWLRNLGIAEVAVIGHWMLQYFSQPEPEPEPPVV